MKGLGPAGAAALLLLMITPAADAQDEGMKDHAMRMIARSEAKHIRSRKNLIKILPEQPNFWVELQSIAKRLKTEPAWLLNVMASESLFDPTARNRLPGQTATGLLQFIEKTAQHLGTTTEAIRRMSPVEQLRLVEPGLDLALHGGRDEVLHWEVVIRHFAAIRATGARPAYGPV